MYNCSDRKKGANSFAEQTNAQVTIWQAWILPPDIGQSRGKSRVLPEHSCPKRGWFFFISYQRLKTQKPSVSLGLSYFGFTFYEHFNRQITRQFTYLLFYIQNHKICLNKKILYQYFVAFLPCLRQYLLWIHFICHYIALKTWKYKPPLTL